MKNNSTAYDYIIVGAGLSGLSLAAQLSQHTERVLLIDSMDFYGGYQREVASPQGPISNGLRFLPNSPLAEQALRALSQFLGEDVTGTITENPPLTFEGGSLKDFVGFGENTPEFYSDLQYFLSPSSLKPSVEFKDWAGKLFARFKGEFMPHTSVTKFNANNGKVEGITINGQKVITAENVIYTGPAKGLLSLLNDEALPAKHRSKLAKSQMGTVVCLDLIHSQKVTDQENIHVLQSSSVDDPFVCLGKFQPSTEGSQLSQWVTYLADEEAEDSDLIGTALKAIKRQIKRAYPESLDALSFERILVAPSHVGSCELKLTGHQQIPGLDNLWICSPRLHPIPNLVGSLLQSALISSAMGFSEKMELPQEITPEMGA